jgi:hypothetical protein
VHIEIPIRAKIKRGLAPKTVRNLIGLLQGIFSLAEDNDLIAYALADEAPPLAIANARRERMHLRLWRTT